MGKDVKKTMCAFLLQSFLQILDAHPNAPAPAQLAQTLAVYAATAFLFACATAAYLGQGPVIYPLLFFASFAAVFAAGALYYVHAAERRKKRLEERAPDMLMRAALVNTREGFDGLLAFLAAEQSEWGRAFSRVRAEIAKGTRVPEALHRMARRARAPCARRVAELLEILYESGAPMQSVLRQQAAAMSEQRVVERERSALLALQKYTLLASAALLVPLILAMVTAMSAQITQSAVFLSATGARAAQDAQTLTQAIIIYIIELGVLVSVYIALTEKNPAKAALYAPACIACALLLFFALA